MISIIHMGMRVIYEKGCAKQFKTVESAPRSDRYPVLKQRGITDGRTGNDSAESQDALINIKKGDKR